MGKRPSMSLQMTQFCSFLYVPRLLYPVMQSKTSQKEKNKYHILTYICGI